MDEAVQIPRCGEEDRAETPCFLVHYPGQSTRHEHQERPLDKRVRRLGIQTGHFKSIALASLLL